MLEMFIVAAVSFWLGWKASQLLLKSVFNRVLDSLGITKEQMRAAIRKSASEEGIVLRDILDDAAVEVQTKTTIELKVEQVGTNLMAYTAKDDFFVAQGADAQGLFEVILKKFPIGSHVEIVEGGELINDYLMDLKQRS